MQQLQYRPAIFNDPSRALAAVAAEPTAFAAVITDLTMPGMTGVDLVREVRRLAGPLPAVIVTGNRRDLAPDFRLEPIEILDKPFTGDDLGRVLQRLLAPA